MVPHEPGRAARRPDGRVRDNGRVTEPSARPRSAPAADDVLAAAVELARAAAVETAGDPALVGDHLGALPEPVAPETGEVAPEVLGRGAHPHASPAGCPATSAGTGP